MLITDTFVFSFQIGDGDINYVTADEISPLVEPEKFLGTETHSLSKLDAWRKAVASVRRKNAADDVPYLYMLSTDGFSNKMCIRDRTCTGIGSGKEPKEATNTAFNYLKANGNAISGNISTTTKDYIINYQDMQGLGMTGNLALPTLIAISSAALSKPPISSLAVLGEISIGGTLIKVEDLASTLQVCLDSGAKKVLLPITSAADLGTVPSDLVGAFSLIFYSSPEEAVYKALGVE